MVIASRTDVGQSKGLAVRRGLRSLLRRTRSFFGCRLTAPSFWCVVIAVLLMPATSWAQLKPDPPPPGLHGSQPTRLEPDTRPAPTRTVPPAPPAPVEETVAAPAVKKTVERAPEPPEAQTARPAPRQVSPQPVRAAGRPFASKQKLSRRAPRRTATLTLISSDSDSRPYVLAALSLAVLVLGSGTLLTVLARLRSTRQGLA